MRRPLSDFHSRIALGSMGTVGNSPIAASRASLRVSSRSVFRLTFCHFHASPAVLATATARPNDWHTSVTHPAPEHASITTTATGSRPSTFRSSSGVVRKVRNRVALVAGS
nr:hypothetical protein [Limnoglobus roseus]